MPAESKEVRRIFLESVEIESADERAEFLAQETANNDDLRHRVEALIEAHEGPESLLDRPPLRARGGNSTTDEFHTITEQAGDTIGPYKLLQEIGEGGFGVVYMADQTEPIARRVALKIIKPGMDTRQVIARFEAERQALALMDHPHIATVIDAGATDTGRPYFVMELVKGVPITEYCDQRQLTPRQRLELFLPVCHAIQHAHQKGIIHRDIKPSNVLVANYDDQAIPKIIDFGVAKAIQHRLTEKTLFTEFGQVLGTVEYMSPEQAKMNQWDVDTRSDVYSLGVLLYELLAGETPFDRERLRSAAFDELLRIIREEEPPRPSMRISTNRSLPTIATNRHTEPQKLSALVRGELDWIVMKALEKDRTRRYESANSFAEDVQHFLRGDAVDACPPSVTYRFRKFARRHRTALATVAVVALAMTLGILVSTWQAVRATNAERVAQHNLDDANKQRQRAEVQAEAAELARQREQEERIRADENFQRARQAVDTYFTATSENELLNEAGMAPLRKELLEAALKYYDGFAAQQVDDPVVLGQLAAAHSRIAQIYAVIGSAEWPTAYARCLDIVERLQREGVDPAIWAGSMEGTFRYDSSNAIPRLDEPRDALRVFERGVEVYGKLAEAYPDVVAFQEELATNSLIAAYIQNGIGQQDQALPSFRHALGIWERLARKNPAHPHYADHMAIVFNNLPVALRALGRDDEIEDFTRDLIATIREIFGNENRTLAHILQSLGGDLARKSRLDEAEGHLREAQAICEVLLDHQKTPRSLPAVRSTLGGIYEQLAKVLMKTGRPAEAEQLNAMASSIASELASQSSSADYLLAVINDLLAQGNLTAALAQARSAARLHPDAPQVHQRLMDVLVTIGDAEQTLAVMRENAQFSPESEPAHRFFGRVLKDQEQFDEAVREFQRGLEINPYTPLSHYNIAQIRLWQDKLPEALDAARSAIRLSPSGFRFHDRLLEVLNAIGDDEHTLTVMRENAQLSPDSEPAHHLFGRVLKDRGRLDAALREYESAIEINRNSPWSHFHISEIRVRQNRLSEALEAARSAVRLDPNSYQFHAHLARLLNRIGDDERTLAVMRENAQLLPDSQAAHHWYGRVLQQQGRLDDAVREFARVLEINPDNAWAYSVIAELRLRQNMLPEALDAARSAVRLNPSEYQFHAGVLEVLSEIGGTGDEAARQELALLSEKLQRQLTSVEDPLKLNGVAWNLVVPREISSKIAVQAALRARELSPDNADILNTLGVAQYRQGDYAAAIESLKRSRECADETVNWALAAIDGYFLAMSNAKLGHAMLAERWFRAADLLMALFAAKDDELSGFRYEAIEVLGIEAGPLVAASVTPESEQELFELWLAADPDGTWIHRWLGQRLAERGAGAEANENEKRTLIEGFEEAANTLDGSDGNDPGWGERERALVYVKTKQFDAYRRLCRIVVQRAAQSHDVDDASFAGVKCKLAPNALTDYTPVLKLLENAVNQEPENRLFLGVQAHLLFRSGKAALAAEQLEQLVSTDEVGSIHEPFNKLFLAMAHHDLGHEVEAERYFREGADWIDKNGQAELQEGAVRSEPLGWTLRLELEILRAEAKPKILAGG